MEKVESEQIVDFIPGRGLIVTSLLVIVGKVLETLLLYYLELLSCSLFSGVVRAMAFFNLEVVKPFLEWNLKSPL